MRMPEDHLRETAFSPLTQGGDDDPVASPAVFNALRRANEAVQAAETRARDAEGRARDLAGRTVELLAAVEVRIAAADARVQRAEAQIAEERKVAASLRERLGSESRTVETLERHAAEVIEAAETRAREAEERLERICDMLRDILTAEDSVRRQEALRAALLH